jgi:hypothetical protein
VFLLLLLCPSVSLAADLRTLSGKVISGDLVSLSDKEIVLRAETGPVTTPLAEVLSLDLQAASGAAPAKYTQVVLTDGTTLQCSQVRIPGGNAELPLATPEAGKEALVVKVPLSAVAHVLQDAHDPAVRQEWQDKYLAKKGNEDILKIKTANGPQRLDGTFGNGDAKGERIEFRVGQRSYNPELARVLGMVFIRKTGQEPPAPLCKVQDLYHNVLAAAKVDVENTGLTVTTAAGARVTYPRALVARIDFSSDKVAFLSDLQPVQVVEKSSLDNVEHYRRDRNLDNGPIRLGGVTYSRGLALHSRTELVFDLEGKYKEFQGTLGVDDNVGGDSNAVVQIEGDGRELFRSVVTRKDKPRPLALDVKGVKQLRIVVGSQGLLELGDHVDLADAKVSK